MRGVLWGRGSLATRLTLAGCLALAVTLLAACQSPEEEAYWQEAEDLFGRGYELAARETDALTAAVDARPGWADGEGLPDAQREELLACWEGWRDLRDEVEALDPPERHQESHALLGRHVETNMRALEVILEDPPDIHEYRRLIETCRTLSSDYTETFLRELRDAAIGADP